jgi:hypothetical protein
MHNNLQWNLYALWRKMEDGRCFVCSLFVIVCPTTTFLRESIDRQTHCGKIRTDRRPHKKLIGCEPFLTWLLWIGFEFRLLKKRKAQDILEIHKPYHHFLTQKSLSERLLRANHVHVLLRETRAVTGDFVILLFFCRSLQHFARRAHQ